VKAVAKKGRAVRIASSAPTSGRHMKTGRETGRPRAARRGMRTGNSTPNKVTRGKATRQSRLDMSMSMSMRMMTPACNPPKRTPPTMTPRPAPSLASLPGRASTRGPAFAPDPASAPRPRDAHFQPALRSVAFCSYYIYSPRGGSFVSRASRQLCDRLKLADATWLPRYAGLVRKLTTTHDAFAEVFGGELTLVPIPSSDPSATRIWAAERLAVALHGVGLGRTVWPGIQRRFPVRKSATALNADRPTTQLHYESLSVPALASEPEKIVLIDDVITKGRTILAAAARLHQALPNTDIRAFALVRTMGFLPDVACFVEPCKGYVRWGGGDARRDP
jgi:predicted amidophosphoribosyltransferase